MAKRSRAKLFMRRLPFFAILFLPLFATCIVIAALTRFSSIENRFVVGTVTPTIHEEFDNYTKENVFVQNEGNSPIYVRMAIIYNFVDQDNVTLFESPVINTDYAVSLSNSSNWLASSDGYYYYKNILEPNASTDILIDNIRDLTNDNEKQLSVDIIVQGIQAYPDDAVRESWNVNINNGILSLRNQ